MIAGHAQSHPIARWLSPLASLRMTVAIFALAMFLIFAGTLAQRFEGNWEVVNTYFRSWWVMIPLEVFLPAGADVSGELPGVPFPGGFALGALLLVNLIAAHTVRFKLTSKRIGIIGLHLGVIVLILGEFTTAWFADEGVMRIHEGASSSYTEDLREVELAVTRPIDEQREQVVVIPQSMLLDALDGSAIAHDDLPFDVSVIDWLANSTLLGPQQAGTRLQTDNPADAGHGTMVLPAALPPVAGVDEQEVNRPAAYIRLSKDGQTIGTYLVTTNFADTPMLSRRQPVAVDGRTYEIELRLQREYRPYRVHLVEARHDKFLGTQVPRNFSSLVQITDGAGQQDREVLIWMNHPLYYRGETFFQHQMGQAGQPFTVLQVVRNPGWLMPYIACILVAAGMLLHFGTMMFRFVDRQASGR